MTKVDVTPRARSDIFEILSHLKAVAGANVASKFGALFDDNLLRLEDFPGIGAPRPRLGRDIRILAERPYLIIYEHGASVTVLRVLDGRRNITRKLVRET